MAAERLRIPEFAAMECGIAPEDPAATRCGDPEHRKPRQRGERVQAEDERKSAEDNEVFREERGARNGLSDGWRSGRGERQYIGRNGSWFRNKSRSRYRRWAGPRNHKAVW